MPIILSERCLAPITEVPEDTNYGAIWLIDTHLLWCQVQRMCRQHSISKQGNLHQRSRMHRLRTRPSEAGDEGTQAYRDANHLEARCLTRGSSYANIGCLKPANMAAGEFLPSGGMILSLEEKIG